MSVSARFGFDIDPDAKIEDLPVGAHSESDYRALSRDARLVLDEPTAVLTPQETDELMAIMKQLAQRIIIFIPTTREARGSDKITVIRRESRGRGLTNSTEAELANLMVGRPVLLQVHKDALPRGCRLRLKTSLCWMPTKTSRWTTSTLTFTR